MADLLAPARLLFYASRGLVRRCHAVLTGPIYDLGDLDPDPDEVLVQLLERNG